MSIPAFHFSYYAIVDKTPAIRCRGLIKDYDDLRAINGLDLEVRAGECFGLLGPNGAGKTTTVEILEGLLPTTSGEVELLGRTWATDADWLRQRLGISLQETNLPDKLTVQEILHLFRSFYAAGPEVRRRMLDRQEGEPPEVRAALRAKLGEVPEASAPSATTNAPPEKAPGQ